MSEVPQVKTILEEELSKFSDYMQSLEMLPLIADMRQQAEIIRQAELEKTLRRLPDLSEGERTRIEAMTLALVKKLLEAPTHRLRAEASCPHAPQYAAVARTLFGLHKSNGLCGLSGNVCPISTAAD
jgi:glutamyl-tRNA reductase